MKFTKLRKLSSIAAALSVLALAACGNDADEPAAVVNEPNNEVEAPAEEPTVEDVTFSFNWWGNDGRHDATQAVANLFMEENPHVYIDMQFGAWDGWQTTFAGDLMANTEADLMQVNFNWLALYSPFGDTFMDLEDPRIAAHLDLSNWNAADIDVVRRNGVVQAVPVGMTARVPFLRTDIYEAAGLDIQDINTWEDLMAAGRQIQDVHGDEVFALSPLGAQSMAYLVFSYIEQFTGRSFVNEEFQFNYSLEELTRGFQLIQDFMDNGVMPNGQFDSDPINAQNPLWIEGAYAGASEWDSSINAWINNLKNGAEVIGIRDHFTYEGALSSGWMARPSMAFAISRNTEHPEIVAEFLNFMLTDERAIEIMGTDRGVPLNTVGRAYFDAHGFSGVAVEANALHAAADTTTMNPVFEFPEVREVYESQLMAIFNGVSTVEEAATFVYENVQSVINSLVD